MIVYKKFHYPIYRSEQPEASSAQAAFDGEAADELEVRQLEVDEALDVFGYLELLSEGT